MNIALFDLAEKTTEGKSNEPATEAQQDDKMAGEKDEITSSSDKSTEIKGELHEDYF